MYAIRSYYDQPRNFRACASPTLNGHSKLSEQAGAADSPQPKAEAGAGPIIAVSFAVDRLLEVNDVRQAAAEECALAKTGRDCQLGDSLTGLEMRIEDDFDNREDTRNNFV